MEPSRATVTRLRLGLEASRPVGLGGGAVLTPSLEVGVRHDGGDAETGFGLDLGGGLALSDPKRGLQAELSGRGLLAHRSKGFRDLGFSGSLAWEGKPSSDRGAKLRLTQTLGGSSSGGANSLLARGTLEGLAANDNGAGGNDELKSRRLELKVRLRPVGLRRPLHLDAGGRRRPVGHRAQLQPRLAAGARRVRRRRRLVRTVLRGAPARERERRHAAGARGRPTALGSLVAERHPRVRRAGSGERDCGSIRSRARSA